MRKKLKIESDKSAAYRDMSDAEFVLRYITLRERVDQFSGSLVGEMDNFMRAHKDTSDAQAKTIVGYFDTALSRCEQIWGDEAFKRPEGTGWRDQTLAGMYDAQMVAAGSLSASEVAMAVANSAEVWNRTRNMFADAEFDKAVRTGTNTPARIRYRIAKMKAALEF